MDISHQPLRLVQDDLVSNGTTGPSVRLESNAELIMFPIFVTYYCGIIESEDDRRNRNGLSVKRPCIPCFGMIKDKRQ